MKPFNWKAAVARSLFWYSLETGLAVVGFVYGFGLTVQNWPMLIGTMVFGRWVVYLINASMLRKRVADEYAAKQGGAA